MALDPDACEGGFGGREESRVAGSGDEGNALVRCELFILSSCQELHEQLQGDLNCRVSERGLRAANGTDALLKKSEGGNSGHLGAN